MPYFIGIVLALAVALFARVVGFDRDRAFYPTVLAVIAGLYGLFGVMGGSTPALLAECGFGAVFLVLAVLGFKYSAWLTVIGLVGTACSISFTLISLRIRACRSGGRSFAGPTMSRRGRSSRGCF